MEVVPQLQSRAASLGGTNLPTRLSILAFVELSAARTRAASWTRDVLSSYHVRPAAILTLNLELGLQDTDCKGILVFRA